MPPQINKKISGRDSLTETLGLDGAITLITESQNIQCQELDFLVENEDNSIVSPLSKNPVHKNQCTNNHYISHLTKYILNISIVREIGDHTISLLIFIFCVFLIRNILSILIPIQHSFLNELCILIDEFCVVLLHIGILLTISIYLINLMYQLLKALKKIQKMDDRNF